MRLSILAIIIVDDCFVNDYQAGLVCNLKTLCSVIAATNAKGGHYANLEVNSGLSTPLLSRFDLILVAN